MSVVRRRLRGARDKDTRVLYLRLQGDLWARWCRHVQAEAPEGSAESWRAIVSAWLYGRDHVAVAEECLFSRAWAYELVSEFRHAVSYFLYADDLRASVCKQTHQSAGGRGQVFNREQAGLFAKTCSACSLLSGATWDGWAWLDGEPEL